MSTEVVADEAELDAAVAVVASEDETRIERRMRALSLRNAGATFTQIAERCHVSVGQARKDVERARRDLIDEASREKLIADQRAVLLDIRRANYPAMTRGDIDAAKIILSSLEREAKLFGLDAPSRMSIGIGTDVEFAETLSSLIESVGYKPPDDLLFTARGDRGVVIDQVTDEQLAQAPAAAVETIPRDEWTNI